MAKLQEIKLGEIFVSEKGKPINAFISDGDRCIILEKKCKSPKISISFIAKQFKNLYELN